MEKLQPLDALFVDAEDEDLHTSMAIASIVEGPPPSHEEFLAFITGRCHGCPATARSSARCRSHGSVSVDDPHFDLVSRPADRCRRLEKISSSPQLMARVMSQRLDRDHPLWEYWVVEGLFRDRWALIPRCTTAWSTGPPVLNCTA